MNADHLSYGDVMYRQVPFVIPPYQRAYAWTSEDVDDFIKDVNDLVTKRESEPSYQHFFGGIVCVDTPVPRSHEGNQYLVIDGQQRLATFAMILALIVRKLEQISQEVGEDYSAHAKDIKSRYLESSYVDSQDRERKQPRLVLSKVDQDFFSSLLWNEDLPIPIDGRESHKLLKRAWNKLRKGLIEARTSTTVPPEQRRENLLNLRKVITEGCFMILIISRDEREAYRLFMTLNDRGRSLSAGDLLKSHTLELLEEYPDAQATAELNWSEMLKGGYKQVEDFLRTYLPSREGRRAGRLTLYDDLCDAFFNFDGSVSQEASRQISHEINEMRRESLTYSKVVKGEWPYENPTRSTWYTDRLNRLSHSKILKHALCYPLLLAARHRLSEEQFAEIVQMLELFIFRYVTICKAHAGRLGEEYYKHCCKIRSQRGDYSVDDLRDDLRLLMEEDTTDLLFENRLTQVLTYSQAQSSRVLHFLSTIESYRAWYDAGFQGQPTPDTSSVFDLPSLHVEHIYPQSPRECIEELEPLKDSLGNLSFWSGQVNRSVRNDDFVQKKTSYGQSSISLNRYLASLDNWNRDELLKRQRKLVDMAVKIFTI